jgi:hypothetical protein
MSRYNLYLQSTLLWRNALPTCESMDLIKESPGGSINLFSLCCRNMEYNLKKASIIFGQERECKDCFKEISFTLIVSLIDEAQAQD